MDWRRVSQPIAWGRGGSWTITEVSSSGETQGLTVESSRFGRASELQACTVFIRAGQVCHQTDIINFYMVQSYNSCVPWFKNQDATPPWWSMYMTVIPLSDSNLIACPWKELVNHVKISRTALNSRTLCNILSCTDPKVAKESYWWRTLL